MVLSTCSVALVIFRVCVCPCATPAEASREIPAEADGSSASYRPLFLTSSTGSPNGPPEGAQEGIHHSPRPTYPPNIPSKECEHLPPKAASPTQPGSAQRCVCISHSTVFRKLRHLNWERNTHMRSLTKAQPRGLVFAKYSPPISHLKALKFSYQPPTKDKRHLPRKNIPELLPVKASISDFALMASTYRKMPEEGRKGAS